MSNKSKSQCVFLLVPLCECVSVSVRGRHNACKHVYLCVWAVNACVYVYVLVYVWKLHLERYKNSCNSIRCDAILFPPSSSPVWVWSVCGRGEGERRWGTLHSNPHSTIHSIHSPLWLYFRFVYLSVFSVYVPVCVCVSFIYFSHVLIRCRLESAFVGLSSVCPLYLPFRRRILIHAQDRQLQHTHTHIGYTVRRHWTNIYY